MRLANESSHVTRPDRPPEAGGTAFVAASLSAQHVPMLSADDPLFEHWPTALFVLDRGSLICLANRAARAVLKRGDGLRLQGGRLAASGDVDKRLTAAVRETAVTEEDGLGQAAVCFLVPRSAGRQMAVTVSSLGRTMVGLAPGQPAVLVNVVDPDAPLAGRVERLRDLYRLTRSEAALALGLAHGCELKTVAADLRITTATARQYLARVFAKTGTSRQGELIRLLILAMLAP